MNYLLLFTLFAWHIFVIVTACHALLRKRDPRSAFGWVAVILLVPVGGALLYWFFGIARVDSRAIKLMERAARRVLGDIIDLHGKHLLAEPPGYVPEPRLPAVFQRLASPGRRITGRGLSNGNTLTPLHNGETAYPAMLAAIAEARERVYLSSFIFGYDEVGKAFAAALSAAARRGCDVRLLVDGVGSFHFFDPWCKALDRRVQMAFFLPPTLLPPQYSINLRTHRKVLVCDSHTAFTGGMNISQHHLVELPKPDRVQDLHFRCRGPIAQQLEVAFLLDWGFTTGSVARTPLEYVEPEGSSLCRILMDGPGSPEETIHDLFCAQISSARRSVRIMSPYFLPPHQLAGALTSAVLRGVDVSVVLPLENNHRLVDWAMRHQCPMLMDKGVRIFYQPPPFAHTKLLLVDETYTLLGSANLDPRSLNLNFELVMEVIDPALTLQLVNFYDHVKSRSIPFPEESPSLISQLRNAAAWMFSPYL